MKKIILVLFVLLFSTEVFSITIYRNYNIDGQGGEEGGYNLVYASCSETVCDLVCIGGGDCECSFTSPCFIEPPELITDPNEYFSKGNGQAMIDYANNQINNNILEGTYSNNLIIVPENTTYYRTVTWELDTEKNTYIVNLSMTIVIE